MDRSTPIYLLSAAQTQNGNGEYIRSTASRMVYCNLRSVSRTEWSTAGDFGLRAEYQATVFGPDYEGEEVAELELRGGKKSFVIYRTYMDSNENLELYLGNRAGVSTDVASDDELTPAPAPAVEEVNDGNQY